MVSEKQQNRDLSDVLLAKILLSNAEGVVHPLNLGN